MLFRSGPFRTSDRAESDLHPWIPVPISAGVRACVRASSDRNRPDPGASHHMARAEANSLFAEGRAREKRGAPERRPEVSRARWVMFPAILTSNRCFSPHSRILGSALRPRTAEERPQADCVSQSAEDDTAKLGGLRGLEPDLMTGRTIELASRGMKLALAGMLAAAVGGCVSSARDAYYSTRSEEIGRAHV